MPIFRKLRATAFKNYGVFILYSQTSLIRTPVIRAPPSTGQLICPINFYADIAKIVGNTVDVVYYSLYIYNLLYSEIRTNLSYGHPLIPRCLDKRGLTVAHKRVPYKWLFSRVVYFTNGPSFSISRILISRMAARDHIFLILVE